MIAGAGTAVIGELEGSAVLGVGRLSQVQTHRPLNSRKLALDELLETCTQHVHVALMCSSTGQHDLIAGGAGGWRIRRLGGGQEGRRTRASSSTLSDEQLVFDTLQIYVSLLP
jgi:hypothetical protein